MSLRAMVFSLNNTNYIRKQLVKCLLSVIDTHGHSLHFNGVQYYFFLFFNILVLIARPFGTKCETDTRWGTTTVLTEDIVS